MLSATPSGRVEYPDLESNQDQDLRRVSCDPLHHRDVRADDWICTSIIRFTRPAPCYVEELAFQVVANVDADAGIGVPSSIVTNQSPRADLGELSFDHVRVHGYVLQKTTAFDLR